MKENVIKSYKEWAQPHVKWYGDFDSAEDLVFKEDKDCTINVTHPEGAEDYGEGDNGGVNGFIAPNDVNEYANYIINIVNDKDKLLEVSNNCYRDLYKNWDDTIEFVYN